MARLIGNGINLDGSKITKLADGSAPTDGVNLGQVQALLAGLSWKAPAVRAASTANVTLTAPGASIDGVTLVVGDRVLLKNQTAGAENGIYSWTGASAALTRTTDADTAARLLGAATFVREGTINKDTAWTQNTDVITVGSTPLVWAQYGGGITYTGDGKGIVINGTTITLNPGPGLVNTAAGVAVDTAVVPRKFAQNVGDGSSTTITVNHNLGTTDITYTLSFTATGEFFEADVFKTNANTLTVTTANALASGSARIVVIG